MEAQSKKKEEMKEKHWSDVFAEEVIEKKREPFVITGGITTSGPSHFGTICEFLYPSVIKQALENKKRKADFYFVGDILDAFDNVPFELKEFEKELQEDLGKPLCNTRDPLKCHKSFGEHYLSQAIGIMKALGLSINVVRANELYQKGSFDQYTRIFLKEEQKTKEIVASTSGKKLESMKDWSPIMPICEKCGRIATTRVTWHDDEEYEYVDDRDVKYTKGCGYRGRGKISNHNYKLQWRLHWPAWQAYFNTSIEGSGIDHMTKGGSWDTAQAIHKEILRREPPIAYRHGFVFLEGKKYSKSKGIGLSALDALTLIPPEVLKYVMIEPNVDRNKNINATGDKFIAIYEEVERLSKLKESENRADEKKLIALKLSTKKLNWKAPFLDMLLNYQIYKDWDKVGELLHDKEGVKYLSPYISEWLKRDFEPEKYNFALKPTKIHEHKDVVKKFADNLTPHMSDLGIHNLVYETATSNNVKPSELFTTLYIALIGKKSGPRIGKLIAAIGPSEAKKILENAVN